MNTKAAKRLRREIGYHPRDERKYASRSFKRKIESFDVKTKKPKIIEVELKSIEVHPSDKRSLYQGMKKEYWEQRRVG
jgi:hypothetical protein